MATAIDLLGGGRPAAAFYPGTEFNDDATNWWGPNPAAVLAMLRTVGFARARLFTRPYPSLAGRALRATKHRIRRGEPFRRVLTQGWAVFQAWK